MPRTAKATGITQLQSQSVHLGDSLATPWRKQATDPILVGDWQGHPSRSKDVGETQAELPGFEIQARGWPQ